MGRKSQLARFAVQSDHIKSGGINPKLFRPNKHYKVSVFRIQDKTHKEKIEEGSRVVRERPQAKRLYGWAEISSREVHGIGLKVEDDDDPVGHSSIVGWPKDEEKFLPYQQQLAKQAIATKLPEPIPVPG